MDYMNSANKENIFYWFSTKKSLFLILYLITTTSIQSFFNCCNGDDVKPQPKQITNLLYTHNSYSKPDSEKMDSQKTSHQKTELEKSSNLINSTIFNTGTFITTAQPAISQPSINPIILTQLTSSNPPKQESGSSSSFSIFDLDDLDNLETNKNHIINLIKKAAENELPMMYLTCNSMDSDNEEENEYVKIRNIEKIFEKDLSGISNKFIQFIHENISTENIEEIINQELILLEASLKKSYAKKCTMSAASSHSNLNLDDSNISLFDPKPDDYIPHVMTWLKTIVKDEIREKNIRLEYITSYIRSFLNSLSSQELKKDMITEHQKNFLDITMKETPNLYYFNSATEIKKLLEKNPNMKTVLEEKFKTLYLQKVDALNSKPSAESALTLPHTCSY